MIGSRDGDEDGSESESGSDSYSEGEWEGDMSTGVLVAWCLLGGGEVARDGGRDRDRKEYGERERSEVAWMDQSVDMKVLMMT